MSRIRLLQMNLPNAVDFRANLVLLSLMFHVQSMSSVAEIQGSALLMGGRLV